MAKLTYPSKPWKDGQKAYLMPGLQFVYSLSLRKWVPITPGTSTEDQIQEAFGVRTAEEVDKLFLDVTELQNQLTSRGKVWRTSTRPSITEVSNNDVWIDQDTAKLFFYNASAEAWIQLLPSF